MDSAAEKEGERRLLAPVGRRDMLEKDRIHQYISETDKLKDQYEKQRLLYVACTRAKSSLHLVGHTVTNEKTGDLRAPERSSLLALAWPMVREIFEQAVIDDAPEKTQSRDVEWLMPQLRRVGSHWQPPSPPALPRSVQQPAAMQVSVEYYWAGAEAKLAGTLVHRWLQWAAEGRVSLENTTRSTMAALGRRWLAEQGFRDEVGQSVLGRVEEAISAVLNDEKGTWLLAGEGHTELALTGVVGGVIQTGIIDRVRIDADEHWIVDYKTSTHEGGDLTRFLSEEQRRYSEQLNVYAMLYEAWSGVRPRRALYFPLLQSFVELPS